MGSTPLATATAKAALNLAKKNTSDNLTREEWDLYIQSLAKRHDALREKIHEKGGLYEQYMESQSRLEKSADGYQSLAIILTIQIQNLILHAELHANHPDFLISRTTQSIRDISFAPPNRPQNDMKISVNTAQLNRGMTPQDILESGAIEIAGLDNQATLAIKKQLSGYFASESFKVDVDNDYAYRAKVAGMFMGFKAKKELLDSVLQLPDQDIAAAIELRL